MTEIIKHLDNFDEFELNGVDLSDNMIAEAKIRCENYSHIKIVKADNFKLPFPDNTFDVVTNKLATNFSISEVFRVLRNDGLFVFKEYGLFKGFGGVSELFVGRIKIKDPLVYLQELRQYGWKNMLFNQFFFERVYTKEELINIFSMAPIINDFDPVKDLKTIENAHKNGNIKVLADPFLIVALKK